MHVHALYFRSANILSTKYLVKIILVPKSTIEWAVPCVSRRGVSHYQLVGVPPIPSAVVVGVSLPLVDGCQVVEYR